MAGNAVIGALRVSLGLDSAQFATGLRKAQGSLSGFGKLAGQAFAAIGVAAAGAAVAMGYAVKAAADHADQLSKASQKIGVTVEALSRLEFAAKLSDVSLEQLTTGLGRLSKSMLDVASGSKGPAATAFRALGIAVKDASGQLRSSDQVLADIADRFSRMEDGSTKTALAIGIFGRAGAELIPLLNEGRDGLSEMADEADRLGVTISARTAKAAEGFNDSLTRMNAVFQGIANQLLEALVPSMDSLSDIMTDPKFQQSIVDIATAMVQVAGALALAVTQAGRLAALIQFIASAGTNTTALIQMLNGGEAFKAPENRETAMEVLRNKLRGGHMDAPGGGFFAGFGRGGGGGSDPFTPSIGIAEQIEIAIPPLNELQQAFADLGDTIDSSVSSALSGMVKNIIKGQDALGGLIDSFGRLGDRLIDMAFDQMIQGLLGNLVGIFAGGSGLGSGAIGRGVYGGAGGFFPGFPGFDGGGFTGMGARTGGLDGMGGFLAMLHPNETVLDHSRGQSGGPTINISISGSKQDAAAIAEAVRREVPAAITRFNANPYRR